MLLWYLLVIQVQLHSWPCKWPLTMASSGGDTSEDEFRNTEVSLLLFRSAEHALHKASAYQSQRWEARFLCQLAQKWFYPLSLRAKLGSELFVLGVWVSSKSSSEQPGAESTAVIQPLFQSLLREVLPTTREGAAIQYMWSLDTAWSFERKG